MTTSLRCFSDVIMFLPPYLNQIDCLSMGYVFVLKSLYASGECGLRCLGIERRYDGMSFDMTKMKKRISLIDF